MVISNRTLLRHVALPLVAPAAMVGLYFTPADLVGCVTRGLIALGLASLSTALALSLAVRGIMLSRSGAGSGWWIASSLILITPLVLLVWPLG